MMFPKVKGESLERKSFSLPKDFDGRINLVVIPFRRWQQELVDQWAIFYEKIKFDYTDFCFYELPTLNKGYSMMRFVIDGGMRSGIPDTKIRQRTITLYLNKNKFKKQLKINSEKTIHIFLVKPTGEIIWREKGPFKNSSGENLKKYLA